MNRTYLVSPIECKKSIGNVSMMIEQHYYNHHQDYHDPPLPQSAAKQQRKQRLNKMKERTKALLKNHDWEKYFPSVMLPPPSPLPAPPPLNTNAPLIHQNNFDGTQSILRELTAHDSDMSTTTTNTKTNNNNNYRGVGDDDECNLNFSRSLSAINHLDYDSILLQTNKLQLMPLLLLNTSTTTKQQAINKDTKQIMKLEKPATPHPKRKHTKLKKNEQLIVAELVVDDYKLNQLPTTIFKQKHQQHSSQPQQSQQPQQQQQQQQQQQHLPHQSLTFIADLAQTSTPTRTNQTPITSTPKYLTHDPLMYHPTQTIRNKTAKKPTISRSKVTIQQPPMTTATATTTTTTTTKKCRFSVTKKMVEFHQPPTNTRTTHSQLNCAHCAKTSTAAVVVATNAGTTAHQRTPKRKRKQLESFSCSMSRSMLFDYSAVAAVGAESCDLCNLSQAVSTIIDANFQKNQHHHHHHQRNFNKLKTKSARLKLKTSNIEISLQDLLYTPSKVPTFDLLTGRPSKAKASLPSKVYYL